MQERVAHAVETGGNSLLDQYARLEQSLGGRYISADLFKETFDPYNRSRVHNAAAVLASEQRRRVLAQPAEPGRESQVIMSKSSKDSPATSSGSGKDSPKRPGAKH